MPYFLMFVSVVCLITGCKTNDLVGALSLVSLGLMGLLIGALGIAVGV